MKPIVLVLMMVLSVACGPARTWYRAETHPPFGSGGDKIELPDATIRVSVSPHSTDHRNFDVKVQVENRGELPLLFTSEGARLSADGQTFAPVLWKGFVAQAMELDTLAVPAGTAAGILCSFETYWSREWHPGTLELVVGTVSRGGQPIDLGRIDLVPPE